MTTFLEKIFAAKKLRLEAARRETDFDELRERAGRVRAASKPHRLREALRNETRTNIIAEIKRASPSKGIINDKIDVAETARNYEKGGACAVSVLTEQDFFAGCLTDLQTVADSVALPVLRKDFIFDEFQIAEAAAAGADAVLLIAAMLEDEVLAKLQRFAEEDFELDVLLEVHTRAELERARKIGARIVGVNNRDLHSFAVSLDVSRELIKHAPADALMISESGLRTREDLLELKNVGFSGFLIGETLMRSGNAKDELRRLTADEHEILRK